MHTIYSRNRAGPLSLQTLKGLGRWMVLSEITINRAVALFTYYRGREMLARFISWLFRDSLKLQKERREIYYIDPLDCPFCGSDATVFYFGDDKAMPWQVVCVNCCATQGDYVDRDDAVDAWNSRAVSDE